MGYILEWPSGADPDPLCLVRHVRVFRRANSLKAFVQSRAFRRGAVPELRLQWRQAGRKPQAVVTSCDAIAAWDPAHALLPVALPHPRWAEALAAMSVRAHLVERVASELQRARTLDLLSEPQIRSLVEQLKAMLAERAAYPPGS